jgi:hypothetical protein
MRPTHGMVCGDKRETVISQQPDATRQVGWHWWPQGNRIVDQSQWSPN